MSQENESNLSPTPAGQRLNENVVPVEPPVLQEHELAEDSLDPAPVAAAAAVAEPAPVEAPIADSPVVEEPVVEVPQTKSRVLIEFSVNHQNKLLSLDSITMPSGTEGQVQQMIEDAPNVSLTDTVDGREWVSTLRDSVNKTTYSDMLHPATQRPDSNWRQYAEHNGVNVAGGYPKYKADQGGVLSGSQAVVRMLNHLGMGNLYSAPMWHSGFWITFRPPTESALVDLNHLLASDKITFGRLTYGLVYSNLSAYTTDRLMSFALDHVFETTIKPEDLTNRGLLALLRVQDIPLFLHGFLCATYPRGFNYRRACVQDASKCNHVVEETLNLRYLNIVDNSELVPTQKNHMTKRARHTMDLKSVERYQEEMSRLHPRKVEITQSTGQAIQLLLKSPSVAEHTLAGHRWVDSMVEMVEEALGKDVGTTERNSLLQSHGLASILCQYSHWVSEIEFGENVINDRETVDSTLAQLSADDEMRDAILDRIKAYINDTTISLIGIPAYDCPKCGAGQHTKKDGKPIHVEVIPLDLIQVFYSLVRQRIARLTRR